MIMNFLERQLYHLQAIMAVVFRETPDDIKKLETNANVTKGFAVHYSKVLDSEDDVKSWLQGLGY